MALKSFGSLDGPLAEIRMSSKPSPLMSPNAEYVPLILNPDSGTSSVSPGVVPEAADEIQLVGAVQEAALAEPYTMKLLASTLVSVRETMKSW